MKTRLRVLRISSQWIKYSLMPETPHWPVEISSEGKGWTRAQSKRGLLSVSGLLLYTQKRSLGKITDEFEPRTTYCVSARLVVIQLITYHQFESSNHYL